MSKDSRRDSFFARYESGSFDPVSFTAENDYLPKGVCRAGDGALCAQRLIPECISSVEQAKRLGEPVKVAMFDFDGTCIDTSSTRRLVTGLWRRNLLTQYKTLRLLGWGVAYKLNLPRDEEAVRRRVFSVFKGRSASSMNSYLSEFYFNRVDPSYRIDADAVMAAHLEEGHIVVLVSATFEPIAAAAMTIHPIQFAIASRMKIDSSGNYTDENAGVPPEGSDKVIALYDFLNSTFGLGGWELTFAYGDHATDIPMLEHAKFPCAVDPDQKLRRYAISQGWDIRYWD